LTQATGAPTEDAPRLLRQMRRGVAIVIVEHVTAAASSFGGRSRIVMTA
jgi:hypothetical protein